MDSTEYFVMERGRIHVKNTGRSIFLGDSAGVNDNLSNNNSIFIGHKAGKSNFNGGGNTALGFQNFKMKNPKMEIKTQLLDTEH